jgi:hypothetical protein
MNPTAAHTDFFQEQLRILAVGVKEREQLHDGDALRVPASDLDIQRMAVTVV